MKEQFLAFTDKQTEFYELMLQCKESEYTFFPEVIDAFSEVVSSKELASGRKVERIDKDRDFFIRLSNGKYSLHFIQYSQRSETIPLAQMIFALSTLGQDCFRVDVTVNSDQIEKAMELIDNESPFIMGMDYWLEEYSIFNKNMEQKE